MDMQVLWWLLPCVFLWCAPAAQLLDTCILECQLTQQLELAGLYKSSGACTLGQNLLLRQPAVQSPKHCKRSSHLQEAPTGSRTPTGSISLAAL